MNLKSLAQNKWTSLQNNWKNSSQSTKKSVYVMLAILGVILIIVPTVWWQNTQKAESRMNGSAHEKSEISDANADVMIIDVKLTSINTDDYTYSLLMKLRPTGGLAQIRSNLTMLNDSIIIFVKGQAYDFQPNRPITSIELKTTFASGTSNSYPFDAYFDDLDVTTVRRSSTVLSLIPTKVNYFGMFKNYDANCYSERTQSRTVFHITLMRSGTTQFFSVCILILMWALS